MTRGFDLKRLQNTQLDIYKEVERICKKYNIEYFGTWGTALGAVRHEGFIPWDDDIDISMKWNDFKRFEEVCKTELSDKFFLQNTDTDKYYWNPYTKIRINNTTSMDKKLNHMKCHYGICMDIFPITPIPNSKISRAKQKSLINIYKGLSYIPYALYISPEESGIKGKISKLVPNVLKRFLRKIMIGNKHINKIRNYLAREINKYDFDKCDYCGEILTGPYKRRVYKKEIFGESILMKFENEYIPIPKNYKDYLTYIYGEYMKLPDESQRVGHGDTIVDFEKSYEEYQVDIKS